VANRIVEGTVIDMLNIWKALFSCTWIIGVVHSQDMHNHNVDQFRFPICLGVKGN
jgi:hypothetical protein